MNKVVQLQQQQEIEAANSIYDVKHGSVGDVLSDENLSHDSAAKSKHLGVTISRSARRHNESLMSEEPSMSTVYGKKRMSPRNLEGKPIKCQVANVEQMLL